MFRLEGRPRVERAIEWTSRHPSGGPFLWGLGAVAMAAAPIPIAIGLGNLADISGPLRILFAVPAIAVVLLPYPAFVATFVPGYVVGRSRGNGWLAAAGLVAPLAIPVAVATMGMLRSYGGSALVTPLTMAPFFIPFWLGLRRGRASGRRRSVAAPGAT
jgi:hypothetical protein